MTRQHTEEEVRDLFLNHVRDMVDYWKNQQKQGYPISECIDGLAFSILVAIDGGTALPGFILAPLPHKDDKKLCIEEGENYYPQNHKSKVNCDIGGNLHEHFFKR